MIGRPRRSSMAIAWAFIATSTAPFATPSKARARVKIGRLGARIGNGVASKKARIATVVVAWLPKRAVRAPLSESPSNDPAAIPKRAKPRALSLSERACLASGMWGTQLPSAAPLAKNTQDTARRERDRRSNVKVAQSDIWPHAPFCDSRLAERLACASRHQASITQALDQACAGAPRGVCGGSPSNI